MVARLLAAIISMVVSSCRFSITVLLLWSQATAWKPPTLHRPHSWLRGNINECTEIATQLADLSFSPDACLEKLNSCKKDGILNLWDSKSSELAYRVTGMYQLERIGITARSLGIESDDSIDELKNGLAGVTLVSSIVALAASRLEGNLGASLTYLFALTPIAFVGVGSANPALIAAFLESIRSFVDPSYKERRILHEAAHFLSGYLLGLPIAGYRTDAVSPEVQLFDTRRGDDLRSNVALLGEALGEADINCLSVVSLAGAVAECISFGNARGVFGDLQQLGVFMSRCDPPMGSSRQQSQTRWAAATAHDLLTAHKAELEATAAALRQKCTVAECIAAIETCHRS